MGSMTFSFTADEECDHCGQFLSSSDESCDHNGKTVSSHVFREMGEGRESLVGVVATADYKWYKLAEEVRDGWISYEYIGTRNHVNAMLDGSWDSVESLPKISMSVDAPADVEDSISDG